MEAVKWYHKAAERGYAIAQGILGDCYFYGLGVKQYQEGAVDWYYKAAELGDIIAQWRLKEALRWCHIAAEKGKIVTQCKLGDCYLYGKGVEKNYNEAEKWYYKAAKQGNQLAKDRLALTRSLALREK